MKCVRFRNVVFGCFLVIDYIFLPHFAYARRIKEDVILTPEEILAEQGYYMQPGADSVLGRIKMVSFDWGGVLSGVISDKKFADRVKDIFESLSLQGIEIVIVSEGNPQEIEKKLDDLELSQYVESIHQSYSKEPTRTKRAILEGIAYQRKYEDNQILHFEDNPALIEKISFKLGNHPHIAVIGVVGRKKIRC